MHYKKKKKLIKREDGVKKGHKVIGSKFRRKATVMTKKKRIKGNNNRRKVGRSEKERMMVKLKREKMEKF